MNWLEVKVDTAPAGLDAVSERLEALGVTGLVIDDEADFHDFLEHNHQYWDYVDDALMREKRGLSRVTFYLPDDADGEKLLSDARAALSEATFAEDAAPRAKETFHTTASQAAQIARDAEVKKLLIGHFSARYDDEQVLLEEARSVFPNTQLAKETLCISV